MSSQLLLGDEAIALGAIESGISGVYAYPGTPSTEITEYIQAHPLANQRNIHRKWAANEKTAMESALGMSYAGKRALVCMKHVGLNVASDAFMNAAITGVNGGLVILVADDPSMHSSQNEQDSRFFAKFALIPALEPTSQQEAYDMTRFGFDFSEKYKVPVMLRVTTRLAHSRAGVNSQNVLDENPLKLPENPMQFILLPALARKYYKTLLDKQEAFENDSNTSVYNAYFEGSDRSMGIVACGIAFNYLMENYPEGCPFPVVKVSQYPIPKALVQRLESECEKLLILEEGYPLVEEQLKDYFGKGKPVYGRLDGTLPRDGELNPDLVAQAIRPEKVELYQVPPVVVNRPPALCQGCGHQEMYMALNQVMEPFGSGHVFADIGCYTLGALSPFNSINTCVDMGASITMAKGASDAGLFPAVAVIGDSTFTHSGITGLLDAVNEQTNMVVLISDNESTSMTGGQDSSAFGRIEQICEGVGVDPNHIRVVIPHRKEVDLLADIIREEVNYNGVSVIIVRRECVQRATRLRKMNRTKTKGSCHQ